MIPSAIGISDGSSLDVITGDWGGDWWITAIVDVGSRVVCGFGLDREPGRTGMIAALGDMRRRLPNLAHRIAVARRIDEVEWVIPPILSPYAENAGSDLPASRRPKIDLVEGGHRRSGVRLVRLLGDGIGSHRLLTRGYASPLIAQDTSLDGRFDSRLEAEYALETAMEIRNGAVLASLAPLGARGRATAQRNAEALLRDLVTLVGTALPPSW